MKIVSDTSTMYTPQEALEKGFHVLPLSVTIDNVSSRELVEIQSPEFIEKVRAGFVPTSSQPSVGETMEVFELYEDSDEEILCLCMADGLSGTYKSTVGARELAKNKDNIHVINTQILCGPHRYLVEKALELRAEGKTLQEIKAYIEERIPTGKSFLVPQDFDFLKRGGRLTPVAARVGGLLKIFAVMCTNEDGTRIEKYSVKKTLKGVSKSIIAGLSEIGVDDSYLITVAHADVLEQAQEVMDQVQAAFPNCEMRMHGLTPAFITQGGPGCIAVQTIKK